MSLSVSLVKEYIKKHKFCSGKPVAFMTVESAMRMIPFLSANNKGWIERGHLKVNTKRWRMFRRDFKQHGHIACVKCNAKANVAVILDTGDWGVMDLGYITSEGRFIPMTLDHILPKSKSGSYALENCQTMCKVCNSHKQDNVSDEELEHITDNLHQCIRVGTSTKDQVRTFNWLNSLYQSRNMSAPPILTEMVT